MPKEFNKQAVFNKVAKHLIKQKRRSASGGCCLYRGPDNLKCAIGCLIKNKYYSPSLEKQIFWNTSVLIAVEKSLGGTLSEEALWFLKDLQSLHDNAESGILGRRSVNWTKLLKEFAKTRNLKFKVKK